MLVLSRKRDQRIFIGPDIIVTVVSVQDGKVRIGIDAPPHLGIAREELVNNGPAVHQQEGGQS